MGKQLVLVGGGHAHMVTLANLHQFIARGHRVTVIGPSENHYYSGMGPGMLGQTYTPDDIRFATRHVVEKQGGTFVLDKAVGVDPAGKTILLSSGSPVAYDVVSFNCGSYVPIPEIIGEGTEFYTVKPIEKLLDAQKRILSLVSQKKATIGIIGGGPSAIEIAGNIWGLTENQGQNKPAIQIFTRGRLMGRFPESIRTKVARSLSGRGIEVRENSHITRIEARRIALKSGETHTVDLLFLALGVKPSPIFSKSGLPTGPDGGLLVNQFLQSTQYPEMFGGGDCIYFQPRPLDKVGVYAVRENPVLFHNLMAALENTALEPFAPGGDYLLIFNLGGGQGLLRKNRLQFGGRPAFFIKDYIDRRFMKKFQAIE
ncbi:MAG: pyridine nucleotide-disulfide oxidoreductase [Deltaproteobacteria bacterium]|nr:MAG: pyridine nucleotide-disulfide oxidoreductase [Deltaproteobacteria bacterium]